MGKNKWLIALLAGLGVAAGVWGGSKLIKKDWPDRRDELVQELSSQFEKNGAPSKSIADTAAKCMADALIPVAVSVKCPAEGENVMKAMENCIQTNEKMAIILLMSAPVCSAEALKQG